MGILWLGLLSKFDLDFGEFKRIDWYMLPPENIRQPKVVYNFRRNVEWLIRLILLILDQDLEITSHYYFFVRCCIFV